MRTLNLLLLTIVFAIPTSVVHADAPAEGAEQDQDFDDIENAKTPLTLAELLPEGGIEKVDIEYWLVIRMKRDGAPWGTERYQYTSIKPVKGQLVFTSDQGSIGGNSYRRTFSTTYSAKGKLQAYRYTYYSRGRKYMVLNGKVVDNELIIKTTRYDAEGNATVNEAGRQVSLKLLETTLPEEWLPLVRAYHIRKGSLGYRVKTMDISRGSIQNAVIIEDAGTEKVEVDQKQVNAHLLIGSREYKSGTRTYRSSFQYLVLPNGAAFSSRRKSTHSSGDIEHIGKYLSGKEAEEKFLPKADQDKKEPKPVGEGAAAE